jgi:hypothetical protein
MSSYQAVPAPDVAFRKIDIPIGECVQRGWDMAMQNLGPFIGYTGIVLAISFGLGMIPILGWIANWIISPALSAGYFTYTRKIIRNQPATFQDFFEGFQYITPLFLVGLVGGLLTFVGVLLCIVPGLYLAMGYMFASFIVVTYRLDFWPALETSRKAVTANLATMIVFVLTMIGINILGALACLVGLVLSIPVSYCASVVAFYMIFPEGDINPSIPPVPPVPPVMPPPVPPQSGGPIRID